MGELNLTALRGNYGEITGKNYPVISPIVFVLSECVIGAVVPRNKGDTNSKKLKVCFRWYLRIETNM